MVAEIQVSYTSTPGVSITHSADAEKVLRGVWDDITFQESFYVLLLNHRNQVLGYRKISVGGLSNCIVDPKIVFSIALKGLANAIILAHNHPSGNINPSLVDKQLTQRLKSAGELLDIPIFDHLILTADGYYSFADNLDL